jgi:SAM-dependent methyltransferase
VTGSVHETAAAGFVRPDVYERGRPAYPIEAIDALSLSEGMRVADIGCGTGKFTRLLAASKAHVVGIEPLPGMLSAFHELLPEIEAVSGTAEALPLRDAAFDLLTCASAFHWFDHDRAIPELHRVLRPNGRLAIIWNRRDALTGWAHDFWAITEEHRGDTPGYRTGAWREALERSGSFGPITEHSFPYVQRTDLDGLIARVASISFIETLSAATREGVLTRARRFIETHPETKNREAFELPYRTAVYVTDRL